MYIYAVLKGYFPMWGGVLWVGRYAKLKPKIFGITFLRL